MRKENILILVLTALVGVAGCKQDAPTLFNQPDGIYFNTTTDSLQYTFAKYPNRMVDTIKLPVTVLGSPANVDREIAVQTIQGADLPAKEGIHFKLLAPYKMPAQAVSTLLPIVVYRTTDLD